MGRMRSPVLLTAAAAMLLPTADARAQGEPQPEGEPRPDAEPRPADARSVRLAVELRLGGFYGAQSAIGAGAVIAGPHLGVHAWFNDTVGVLFTGGAEIGGLFPPGGPANQVHADGTAVFSGELGPLFNFDGGREKGTLLLRASSSSRCSP
jgi:hypothetical protein